MRRASGCWRLRLGACSVRHCSGQGLARSRASPQKQADSPVHPAKAGTALPADACAYARASLLGPNPRTSGALGFPGWGLRVEPSLGK